MKIKKAIPSIVVVAAVWVGVAVYAGDKPKVETQKIREYVKKLASDEFEGRGTGQKGGDAAADYIAKQFESFGLKPGGEKGSYFQDVPMVGVKTVGTSTF